MRRHPVRAGICRTGPLPRWSNPLATRARASTNAEPIAAHDGGPIEPDLADPSERSGRLRPLHAAALVAALVSFALVVGGGARSQAGASFDGRALLALAAVGLPVVAAAAVLAPWRGLLAWLVIMPLLNAARIDAYLGPLQVIPTTIVVASLCCGWVFGRGAGRAGSARADAIALGTAAAVSGLGLLATFAGGDPATSVPVFVNGLMAPVVLGAVVVALRPTRDQVVQLLVALGASVTIASTYNLFRLLRDAATSGATDITRVAFARYTYYNVGIFGSMLAMTLPLLIALLLVRRRRPGRRTAAVVCVALAIEVVATYLTFTKSAWIGGLVGITLTLLLLVHGARRRVGVLISAMLVAALIVPYPSWILQAVAPNLASGYSTFVTGIQGTDRAASWNPATQEGEVSIGERVLATEAGIRMTIDHPLLGVGPGRFGVLYAGAYRSPGATRALGAPHDLVIDLTSEFGLPLATIVLLALLYAVSRAVLVYRRVGADRWIGAGLIGALFAFATVALTFGMDLYRPWRYMDSDVLFAALLAAAAIAISRVGAAGDTGIAVQPQPPELV